MQILIDNRCGTAHNDGDEQISRRRVQSMLPVTPAISLRCSRRSVKTYDVALPPVNDRYLPQFAGSGRARAVCGDRSIAKDRISSATPTAPGSGVPTARFPR
jgi:hypothetical protein